MLRWLFKKIFKKNAPGLFFYIPPVMGILLCYLTFSEHRLGDMVANIIALFLNSITILVLIAINLRRFIVTLQKPYQSANLHVALGSVFATVMLFAAIYSFIYLYIPNSFAGLNGNTPLDECVNVIYFSTVTFTTVGFGDILPVAPIAKVFVSIETMSFFVFFVILLGNHSVFIKPKEG
ncbi:MAG: ion channel [Oscillospiraceae bacterium]|nr:ion channel [Oscillospiraceae bacterium]